MTNAKKPVAKAPAPVAKKAPATKAVKAVKAVKASATKAVAAVVAAVVAPVKRSMLDAAKSIKAAPRVRMAPTKIKAEPKRPATAEATVNRAIKFFDTLVKRGGLNKVQYVRELAMFDDKVLQRRDAFAIVQAHPELAIAAATVSTQFQFARSGKLKQNA